MPVCKNIQQRGDKYQVQVLRSGKRFCRTFPKLSEAVKFAEMVKQNAEAPDLIKLRDAADIWMEHYSLIKKRKTSVKMDKSRFDKYILKILGDKRLDKIQPGHIDRMIKVMKDNGLTNSTVNRYLQQLGAVFNFFIKRRVIPYNPVPAVGMLKVDEQAFDYWDFQECERFLEHARNKYYGTGKHIFYLLYLMALNTGMRRSELLGLQWRDIDWNRRLITVRRTFTGSEEGLVESTKNRKIRFVPMTTVLHDELYKTRKPSTSSSLVFTLSGKPLDPDNFYGRVFVPDVRESGVHKISFHSLRHTFASHYSQVGSFYHLQQILGHASPKMTMRYAHLSNDFLSGKRDVVQFGVTDKVINVDFEKRAIAG